MPCSNQPALHQQRRGGFWRGTGGTSRWDEREGWCSHLHLSPLHSFLSPSPSNSPSGLTFTLYLFSTRLRMRMCGVTLFILHCPLWPLSLYNGTTLQYTIAVRMPRRHILGYVVKTVSEKCCFISLGCF